MVVLMRKHVRIFPTSFGIVVYDSKLRAMNTLN
jgi:hypothetical protein